MSVSASKLYIVATPIGNLADISERALEVLSAVDRILVEDTRHSGKMLSHFHIKKPLLAYHDHNEEQITEKILDYLKAGESCALISDAGTPTISDPGYRLVSAAHRQGLGVVPIPGPSALITALSASGLAVESFQFIGFAPNKAKARQDCFQQLASSPTTVVFYESPHRILASIEDAVAAFGAERRACVARELTKLYEEVHTDSLGQLLDWLQQFPDKQRGEFVMIIEGNKTIDRAIDDEERDRVLKILLTQHSTKQASILAAEILGMNKNHCYQRALELKNLSD